jgi:putative spermidine/putrescine transport system substrate-binding protein
MVVGKRIVAGAILATALLAAGGAQAQYQDQTLTVASFGGSVDNTFRKATDGFEQKFGVKIRWIPGTTTENAAKVVATKGHPEFDVAFLDNIAYQGLSHRGDVLAKLDHGIVTNYDDMVKQGKIASNDGVPIGFNFTGLYFNEAEFQKRGWAPPASWNDIFRPEFCHNIGVNDPSVSYILNMAAMLGGDDANKIPDGIEKLAKLRGCLPTLEPSGAKLEEKIQLGEYLVGVYGSVRVIPLRVSGGLPLKFVVPKEGTTLSYTAAAVVAGGNEKLAQEFINWIISPPAQKILLSDSYYMPVNSKVPVPENLTALGMPTADILNRAVDLDALAITEHRQEWARKIQRALIP